MHILVGLLSQRTICPIVTFRTSVNVIRTVFGLIKKKCMTIKLDKLSLAVCTYLNLYMDINDLPVLIIQIG